jgi:hypothetical protein
MDEPSWTAAGVVPLRPWRDEVIASPQPQVAPEPSSDEIEKRLAAERRAEAAERDRDWWMAQHDAIMEDWRADVEQAKALAAQLAAVKAAPPAAPATPTKPEFAVVADLSAALSDVLQFYDSQDGSILLQKGGLTLSEAFRRAALTLRLLRP